MSEKKSERPLEVQRPKQTNNESSAEALALPLRNPAPKLVLSPTQPSNDNQSTGNSGSSNGGDKK